jgi:hypothetical protein
MIRTYVDIVDGQVIQIDKHISAGTIRGKPAHFSHKRAHRTQIRPAQPLWLQLEQLSSGGHNHSAVRLIGRGPADSPIPVQSHLWRTGAGEGNNGTGHHFRRLGQAHVGAGRAGARVVRGAKQRRVGDGDAHDLDIWFLYDGTAILAGVLVAGDQLAATPVRPVERVLKKLQRRIITTFARKLANLSKVPVNYLNE